jgi:hypothetical protein
VREGGRDLLSARERERVLEGVRDEGGEIERDGDTNLWGERGRCKRERGRDDMDREGRETDREI